MPNDFLERQLLFAERSFAQAPFALLLVGWQELPDPQIGPMKASMLGDALAALLSKLASEPALSAMGTDPRLVAWP